jgi:hypothetical protein
MGYRDFHKNDKIKRSGKYDMDFRRRFAMSQKNSEKFDDVYYKIYSNLKYIKNVENERDYQKLGIDKILVIDDNATIAIDEKTTSTGNLMAKLCYKYLNTDYIKRGWVYYSEANYVSVMYSDYIYHIPMTNLRHYIDRNFHELQSIYYSSFVDNGEVEVNVLNIPLEHILQNVPDTSRYSVNKTQQVKLI